MVAQANDVVLVTEAEPLGAAAGGPRVLYVNPAFTRMTGYAAADILGRTPRMLQSPKTDQGELDRLRVALARWEPVEVELLNVRKDGTEFWVQINLTPVADSHGWFTHWVAIQRDITARRARESALAAMLASTSDVLLLLDATGRVTDASPSARHVLGTEPDALVGAPVLDLIHPADQRLMVGLLTPTGGLRLGRSATAELRCRQQDGGWCWLEVSAADLALDPARGMVLACADVTARRLAQDQLRHQALHDALTGLPNRLLLLDRLTQVLARPGTTAVLFCDLDRFKVVNDSLGHHAGDLVLTTVAARLQSAVRPEDTVARLSGDEFVVLCPATTPAAAREMAVRLQHVLAAPFPVLGTELALSTAIGVATATPTCTAESLLRDADAAMYAAKEAGPGRVEVFDAALGVRTYSRLHRVTELAHAITAGQLRLHYQPELTLTDRIPVGREALVRWAHPTRGLLPPGDFITLAEDAGLVTELGAWVLETAVADTARLRVLTAGPVPRTWVNVSAHELAHPDFLDTVTTTLDRHQVPGPAMGVEITESVLMADVDHTHHTLTALQELGLGVAVDDFGTGYSSLSYLARFPVDTVKIDRSFTAGLSDPHRRRESYAVISAVVGLAHALKLQIVAEGVETTAQAETLHGLGCDHGQGFLLGRPAPAEAVPDAEAGTGLRPAHR